MSDEAEIEDIYSGEKSVIEADPVGAAGPRAVRFFRSLCAVGVLYGAAAMVFLPYGALRFHEGAIPGDFRTAIYDGTARSTSVDALWLFASSVMGAGLGFLLMAGGLAGVRMRPWSLAVLRFWAISSIAMGIGGSYFYFQWLLPPWRAHLAEVRGVVDSLVNIGGWFIGFWLAVMMLVVTSRRDVRDALSHHDTGVPG